MAENSGIAWTTARAVPLFPAYRVGTDGTVYTCWSAGGRRRRLTNRWRIKKPDRRHAVRAFDVNAAVALLGQCVACGAAAFMKQCGDRPVLDGRPLSLKAKAGTDPEEWPTPLRVRQFPEPHRAYSCGPQGWAEVAS